MDVNVTMEVGEGRVLCNQIFYEHCNLLHDNKLEDNITDEQYMMIHVIINIARAL